MTVGFKKWLMVLITAGVMVIDCIMCVLKFCYKSPGTIA